MSSYCSSCWPLPGELWEESGVKCLLGYALKAPELKNKVAVEFFVKYDCTRIVGNIDFCVSPKRLDPRQRSLEERGAEEDAYSYDTIGNLQFAAFNATTNIYTANNLNQYTSILRASAPPREISHDDDGNMLSDGTLTYAYDSANRLKSVSSNGVMLVTNFYDAKSRRVKKVTPEATHTFFYDSWNLIEERVALANGTTSTIRYY